MARILAPCCAALLVASALSAAAQAPARVYSVAWLDIGQRRGSANEKIFVDELARQGFRDGQNASLRIVSADRSREQMLATARELVAQHPDVLLTEGTPNTRALQSLTRDIPIVFMGAADPVSSGLVKTLARPGANTTGVANVQCAVLAKLVEIGRELVPQATRISLIMAGKPDRNPCASGLKDLAIGKARLTVVWVDLFKANDDVPAALRSLGAANPDLVVISGLGAPIDAIVASLAKDTRRKVPIVSNGAPGAALWLNIDTDEVVRLAAGLVARILRGTPPAELPVALPSTYRMEVDLRAAKEQGVRIPEAILLRAGQISR